MQSFVLSFNLFFNFFFKKFFFLFGAFCVDSVLPVHSDAVKDDGEADVEEEVSFDNNQGNNCHSNSTSISSYWYAQDAERDHVQEELSVSESQENSKQFVVVNSNSMNFQAGRNEKNCWTNDVD